MTKQASCEEGDTCTRRTRRPCRSSTQKVPRSSDGVTIQPKASWTLYEPAGTFVVRATVPSFRDSTRTAVARADPDVAAAGCDADVVREERRPKAPQEARRQRAGDVDDSDLL